MGIADRINEQNKKYYKIEINTNKITDIRQIISEFYKKYKKIMQIDKISLHIEISYWDNSNGE